MTTRVTLTGTGVPHPSPGRAGPGALARCGDIALQFDAGRATVLRLAEAGCDPHALTALFVTHTHSDHLTGLADVVMTRWITGLLHRCPPLPIVAAGGSAERFVERMLAPYDGDIAVRMQHVQPEPPTFDLRTFAATPAPTTVWESDDRTVCVEAVAVHHEPVEDAVAYRVTTPDGVVVVSGDTRVCDEVLELSRGADVLVHEACRARAMADRIAGTAFERIFDYHADTVALGALARDAEVGHLVLTHLIPSPTDAGGETAFADDVRAGGYDGELTVGSDLTTIAIG